MFIPTEYQPGSGLVEIAAAITNSLLISMQSQLVTCDDKGEQNRSTLLQYFWQPPFSTHTVVKAAAADQLGGGQLAQKSCITNQTLLLLSTSTAAVDIFAVPLDIYTRYRRSQHRTSHTFTVAAMASPSSEHLQQKHSRIMRMQTYSMQTFHAQHSPQVV